MADHSAEFAALYSGIGRPSIPPERLLRALLLQAFYGIRSERQIMERLEFDLLFRWFVGLKSACQEAKLCFMGHALMENRNGLVVDACLTRADGHSERVAALVMIEPRADRPGRIPLGADKGYDTEDFVNELRSMNVAPHVAAKVKGSALDGRTTRHAGYVASLRLRKRIDQPHRRARLQGHSQLEAALNGDPEPDLRLNRRVLPQPASTSANGRPSGRIPPPPVRPADSGCPRQLFIEHEASP